MFFSVSRTSSYNAYGAQPCPEAVRHTGWWTSLARTDVGIIPTSARNVRPVNEIFTAYEVPDEFWLLEFTTLEELLFWVQKQSDVVINVPGTFEHYLQDGITKIVGSLEIYDDYRE